MTAFSKSLLISSAAGVPANETFCPTALDIDLSFLSSLLAFNLPCNFLSTVLGDFCEVSPVASPVSFETITLPSGLTSSV